MEQKSLGFSKCLFGFSNCLDVFVSDTVGVFACFPSLRLRCVLKHIASAEGFFREYVFSCGRKTGLLYTSKKFQKNGCPLPQTHRWGIITIQVYDYFPHYVVSIFTLYQKAGVLLKNPKKNTLNTKMRVFFVFFGDGGQNVAAFRIRLSRFNVSTSLWWWKLGSITSWKLEGYKLVAKMVLQTHSKEYTIHTSKIVLQTRCIW